MRKVGKLRNLKPLKDCRGYFHDGSKVYDRTGREVPLVDGKARVLVNFKWVEVDLSKPKPRRKPTKVSEEK
jgi:hypothetical protein